MSEDGKAGIGGDLLEGALDTSLVRASRRCSLRYLTLDIEGRSPSSRPEVTKVEPEGKQGEKGAAGTDGKPVLVGSFEGSGEPAGEPCEEHGGAEFEVEGSGEVKYVCNGEPGEEGKEGSPWTAGGTLPSGAMETGSFWIFPTKIGAAEIPLSFSIPLSAEAAQHTTGTFITKVEVEEFESEPEAHPLPEGCAGNAYDPKAEVTASGEEVEGHLCVFEGLDEAGFTNTAVRFINPATGKIRLQGPEGGVGTTGVTVLFSSIAQENKIFSGTWAVVSP